MAGRFAHWLQRAKGFKPSTFSLGKISREFCNISHINWLCDNPLYTNYLAHTPLFVYIRLITHF
ncbi:MAG TPA: hypothetical protein VMW23_03365, partial [Sedimentisphaerales bacterium]|nr:hypothetical protein [Sedimentisphaerales bacterium]